MLEKFPQNFDIIHHEARGDKLDGPYEGYQTVKNNDLKKQSALEQKKKKTASGILRNIRRNDLFVENKVVKNYFLEQNYINCVILF